MEVWKLVTPLSECGVILFCESSLRSDVSCDDHLAFKASEIEREAINVIDGASV
jgi:hypothetical protein